MKLPVSATVSGLFSVPAEQVFDAFLDKNMIEVFANDRQAAVAAHDHAEGNLGIRLFTNGGDLVVPQVKAWTMTSIYTDK